LYYRVKHDSQLAMYNFKSRTADWDRDQTPEVVPMFAAPKDASGTQRTILDGAWEYYMNDLNGFDRDKLRYLKASNTALFNGAGFPNLESLTMGGNVITLDAIQGDWGEVHTFDFHEVGTTENETYMTRPDLVHKFVVVVWSSTRKKTYWVNPPRGNLYWPLVASHPAWISLSRIEPFPILPMEVTGRVEQEILKEPARDGEPTGEKLSKAEKATVVEYHLAGSQVWGRLSTGRWIALFRYETTGPTYFTTWSMETLPPPP
jgi:hypothetical protein